MKITHTHISTENKPVVFEKTSIYHVSQCVILFVLVLSFFTFFSSDSKNYLIHLYDLWNESSNWHIILLN